MLNFLYSNPPYIAFRFISDEPDVKLHKNFIVFKAASRIKNKYFWSASIWLHKVFKYLKVRQDF